MTREEKVVAFIEARRNTPYAWGQNDCCMFCADMIAELTGVDHAESWRGTYADEESAYEIIAQNGGSLLNFISGFLGETSPPITARVGDIVIGDYEYGEATGVCVGHAVALVSNEGLSFRSLRSIKACWHV